MSLYIQFDCVLFLQVLIFPLSDGVVTLTSSAQGAICPGVEVTLTCTVMRRALMEWRSTAFNRPVRYIVNDPVGQMVNRGIFTATLIFTPPLADFTSTLRVTVTPEAMLNETVVTCSDQFNPVNITLTLAGHPSPPQNPGYHVQHYGPHNVTVTVQWRYPEFDGGVPVDNYTISGTNIMTTTSQINETTLTLPYNARQTIEVAATNCIGTSGTAMFTYFEAGCMEPTPPSRSRGSIDNFQSAAEGATITYSCSPGLVPRTQMSAVCTNMTWRPDLASLQCRQPADCGAPPPPVDGSLQPHTNTTEGSVVVFQCDPGFVPEGVRTAVCGSDGQWSPNPGGVTCSSTPTPTSTQTFTKVTPTWPGNTQMPQMQPWLVPIVVVCICVVVLSCVVIIIVAGVFIVRRRRSGFHSKNLTASIDHHEMQIPTWDEVKKPAKSQISARMMYADHGPHIQPTAEHVALDTMGNEPSLDTQKHIKMKENVSYEVPPSRIKMKENVSYKVPPSRIQTAQNVAYEVPPSRIKTTENVLYEATPSRIKMTENVAYETPPSAIKTAKNEAYGNFPNRP